MLKCNRCSLHALNVEIETLRKTEGHAGLPGNRGRGRDRE